MGIKSILLLYSGSKKEINTINSAFSIGKDFHSLIKCLHVSPDTNNIDIAGVSPKSPAYKQLLVDLEKKSLESLSIAANSFAKIATEHNISTSQIDDIVSSKFIHRIGLIEDIITKEGKTSDILIMNKNITNINPQYKNAINSAIFHTGKPVIFVPNKPIEHIGYNISVAWNGSTEVTRALAYSLPFLKHAKEVNIITIGQTKQPSIPSIKELLDYLSLHKINVKHVQIDKIDNSVGDTLMKKYTELKSDLLIMGAFTHSKLQQMIMGGVTSKILDKATIPVMMIH